jgi:N-carbamoyl-L-amino-acid hydrolase
MIFVPCRKGLSHNAREFVEPEFCITGAQMLLDATLEAVEMIRTQPSGAHAEVAKTAASTA